MNAQQLLDEVRRLGGKLEARGDLLHVEAPKGALSPVLRAALTEHKPQLLATLAANFDDWARLPLSAMEHRHVAIKIRSDDFGNVWLCSTEAERELADSEEPVYTVAEARQIIGLPEPLVRQIHAFKKTFGGIVGDSKRDV